LFGVAPLTELKVLSEIDGFPYFNDRATTAEKVLHIDHYVLPEDGNKGIMASIDDEIKEYDYLGKKESKDYPIMEDISTASLDLGNDTNK
jgi:hypothetical protein